ncbi:MAG: SAM-dependent methyltransferase [Bacteroidales bacterium]
MKGRLYLIPTFIGSDDPGRVFPSMNIAIIESLRYFVVEEIKTARRFIKKVCPHRFLDELTFYELNEHTTESAIGGYLEACMQGESVGLLSEAGVPCVADPGSLLVRLAHQRGIEVSPLVGPSSILLALMASGLNGQSFAFVGYLPVGRHERQRTIRQLEQRSLTENQTQCFMETPYRNLQLFEDIVQIAHPDTLLCIASDLTLPSQRIVTQSVREWQKNKPDIHKHPAIFLLKRS